MSVYRLSPVISCSWLCVLFVRYPGSSLNQNQPKPATCSEVSTIWKCMPKIWDIPPSKNQVPETTYFRPFSTTSQLNGKFNGEYRRKETRYRQSGNGLGKAVSQNKTTKRSLQRFKMFSWNSSTNGLKYDRHFYPPFVNSAFCFIAMQALHTEVSKRNSIKLRQTVGGKLRQQIAEKSLVVPADKIGAKIVFFW